MWSFRTTKWHDPSRLVMFILTFKFFFLVGFIMIIKFACFRFIESLFMSHHSLMFFSSEFIWSSNTFNLYQMQTFVSSTNILNEKNFQLLGRSFIYIKNNKGHNRASIDNGLIWRLGITQFEVLLPLRKVAFKPGQW